MGVKSLCMRPLQEFLGRVRQFGMRQWGGLSERGGTRTVSTAVLGFGIAFIGFESQSFAGTVPEGASEPTVEERRLEASLWACDQKDLPQLEQSIVRMIQKRPESVFAHHLMSHVKLRLFTADPEDLYTLKQA